MSTSAIGVIWTMQYEWWLMWLDMFMNYRTGNKERWRQSPAGGGDDQRFTHFPAN
jgi:hypothetical protein